MQYREAINYVWGFSVELPVSSAYQHNDWLASIVAVTGSIPGRRFHANLSGN
jgi:hypothetical protein